MFTAALFTIPPKQWKQPKCPSTDEWSIKCGIFLQVEWYLAIKREEALIHAATWINLENIMLNERNQSQKATCCRIHFMWNVQNIEIQRTRKWISGCRELREVGFRQGVTANGHWISFWGDRDVLKLPSDDGFTTLWNTKNHWIVHFRRVHFMACELHINFF